MLETLRPGDAVGEYTVVQRLGEGGMGEVYEAVHAVIGKRAAIKVMKGRVADAFDEARRLLEEARAVNAIHHPGIVDIFGAGVLPDGRAWLMMELLRGETLADRLTRDGLLPVADAVWVLEGILGPLAAAHAAGVIHRDLKPSNVFLVSDSSGRRVKLLDFGVARRANRTAITAPQMTVGSLGYMSPEQLMGRPVPASDVYAVGCIAWATLTGRAVFPSLQTEVVLQQHLATEPPRLRDVAPFVPEALADWVNSLLHKRPEARPPDAALALELLREATQRSSRVTQPTRATQGAARRTVAASTGRPVSTVGSPWDDDERTERLQTADARPDTRPARPSRPAAPAQPPAAADEREEVPLDHDAPTLLHRKP
jgi:serine/threonine-protein kinase